MPASEPMLSAGQLDEINSQAPRLREIAAAARAFNPEISGHIENFLAMTKEALQDMATDPDHALSIPQVRAWDMLREICVQSQWRGGQIPADAKALMDRLGLSLSDMPQGPRVTGEGRNKREL